ARVNQRAAVAAGHSREAALERPVGRNQLGHLPQRGELVGQARDALVDQLAPQAASDEVEVCPSRAGPRRQRPRQAPGDLIEALAAALGTAREAMLGAM